MKAGIVAAGSGQRLKAGGFKMAKPLVRVAGRALIEHTIGQMADAGIEDVTVILNDAAGSVAQHLRDGEWPMPVEVIVRTTAHSLESLRVIAPKLTGDRFLVATVDTIAKPGAMRRLIEGGRGDATLGVTEAGDDEHPLFVRMGDDGRIRALGQKAKGSPLVTCGWYLFSGPIRSAIETAPSRLDKLRLFLGHIVESGMEVYGTPIGRSVDVDDAEDVRQAQELLRA